jgi:hypothetical protein
MTPGDLILRENQNKTERKRVMLGAIVLATLFLVIAIAVMATVVQHDYHMQAIEKMCRSLQGPLPRDYRECMERGKQISNR